MLQVASSSAAHPAGVAPGAASAKSSRSWDPSSTIRSLAVTVANVWSSSGSISRTRAPECSTT